MEIIVGGIIEKDNKILMVKEAKKKCYGKWNVPAGHLEKWKFKRWKTNKKNIRNAWRE